MAFLSGPAAVLFLVSRVLFGAVMAFMGLNHVLNVDQMTPYAEMKGVPAPRFSVLFSGGMLLAGGLGIAAGAFPVLAAGAVAGFLLVATPTMHDFWAAPEEDQQDEMSSFLKNLVVLGASVAFLAVGGLAWPFAVGVGLF
ncbi:DoxX family protein [Halomicrobium urmianum]|uniref:DoxX family protein n=1 Tax=Halomicrobium urmianum TaxID=1586233 RepID=UPI001CD9789D|nr:DoxX family membrane protein [Halomicrobium urmianum]